MSTSSSISSSPDSPRSRIRTSRANRSSASRPICWEALRRGRASMSPLRSTCSHHGCSSCRSRKTRHEQGPLHRPQRHKMAYDVRAAPDSQMPTPEETMAKKKAANDAVYKVVEVIGTSTESWEEAARNAVETAAASLRDLRIAEVVKQDMKVEAGQVVAYRTRVLLSFKYES